VRNLFRLLRASSQGRAAGTLVQPEVHFDIYDDRDCVSVFVAGLEAPLANGFHGFFIEPHAYRSRYAHILGKAVASDYDSQNHYSLILGATRFVGIVGFGIVDGARSADSTACQIRTSANTTAIAGANTRTGPRADSSSCARADTSTAAWPIRGAFENA